MPPKKQPLVPKVIVQTNDENTSSDSSSENEYEETAPTINQTNQTTRKAKKKWKDAGLLLPANVFHKKLVAGKYAKKVAKEASVTMTGVLEYLVAEVLEMAKECADANQKKRIQPRHIMMAIKRDQDFNELLKDVTFPTTGVVPFIHESLLPASSPTPLLGKRPLEQPGPSKVPKKKTKRLLTVQNLSDSDDSD